MSSAPSPAVRFYRGGIRPRRGPVPLLGRGPDVCPTAMVLPAVGPRHGGGGAKDGRRFASSTSVSPILRDSALRKMGERSVGVTDRRRLGASSCFSAALQCYSRLLPALPSAVLRWWFWSCRAPQGWSERRPSTGGTTPLACHGSTTEDSPYEACRRLPHPTSSSPHHHLLARP